MSFEVAARCAASAAMCRANTFVPHVSMVPLRNQPQCMAREVGHRSRFWVLSSTLCYPGAHAAFASKTARRTDQQHVVSHTIQASEGATNNMDHQTSECCADFEMASFLMVALCFSREVFVSSTLLYEKIT
eukprot:3296467-Amphidinium_carterae.1